MGVVGAQSEEVGSCRTRRRTRRTRPHLFDIDTAGCGSTSRTESSLVVACGRSTATRPVVSFTMDRRSASERIIVEVEVRELASSHKSSRCKSGLSRRYHSCCRRFDPLQRRWVQAYRDGILLVRPRITQRDLTQPCFFLVQCRRD